MVYFKKTTYNNKTFEKLPNFSFFKFKKAPDYLFFKVFHYALMFYENKSIIVQFDNNDKVTPVMIDEAWDTDEGGDE